ncbi:MAG: hypothetical protein RL761_237 [Pseudomonadota bacterium]
MGKRPTGSGGEPSSPNCGASAGVKARQPHFSLSSFKFSLPKLYFTFIFAIISSVLTLRSAFICTTLARSPMALR